MKLFLVANLFQCWLLFSYRLAGFFLERLVLTFFDSYYCSSTSVSIEAARLINFDDRSRLTSREDSRLVEGSNQVVVLFCRSMASYHSNWVAGPLFDNSHAFCADLFLLICRILEVVMPP